MFAPASGGNANTGNVTFNDINIIGTGNLNLQPDSADAGAYLDIYLTGAADIHVAAGAAGANLILGTDEEANVAVLQGGNVAIQAGNVSGTKTWNFDTAGNLTLPLSSVVYETNIPDGALSGSAIALKPAGGTTANQQLLIYPTAFDGDHIHLATGNLYQTELFLGSDDLYIKLSNTGNIVINSNDGNSNSAMWTFDSTGNATFPANGTTALHNITSNGLALFGQVHIGGNLNYSDDANLIVVEDKDSFADIIAQNKNSGGNASMNIVLINDNPGNVYMAMGVNSSNFTPLYNTLFEIPDAGYVSHSTNQVMGPQSAESGNSSMFFTYNSGSYALELNANGAIGWGASYNGNLTQGNFGNVGQVLTSAGENSAPTWSNITSTSTTNSWTLASGNNTVSISVPLSGTYSIWINGNIPNGIITYTATAVVTNTNVPVLGDQYGWYYAVGNALVLTSIPNQFVGTAGAISNVNTYLGNTANVFTFGITNNSGNAAVVNYGYTKL